MADENFEDDLFADLYDDNDASKTGPGPQQAAPAPDAGSSAAKDESSNALNNNSVDQQMRQTQDEEEEEEDDDDDVDFNLGGGSSGAVAPSGAGDVSMNQASGPAHDDRSHTPPYGSVHRASAKDEG